MESGREDTCVGSGSLPSLCFFSLFSVSLSLSLQTPTTDRTQQRNAHAQRSKHKQEQASTNAKKQATRAGSDAAPPATQAHRTPQERRERKRPPNRRRGRQAPREHRRAREDRQDGGEKAGTAVQRQELCEKERKRRESETGAKRQCEKGAQTAEHSRKQKSETETGRKREREQEGSMKQEKDTCVSFLVCNSICLSPLFHCQL